MTEIMPECSKYGLGWTIPASNQRDLLVFQASGTRPVPEASLFIVRARFTRHCCGIWASQKPTFRGPHAEKKAFAGILSLLCDIVCLSVYNCAYICIMYNVLIHDSYIYTRLQSESATVSKNRYVLTRGSDSLKLAPAPVGWLACFPWSR